MNTWVSIMLDISLGIYTYKETKIQTLCKWDLLFYTSLFSSMHVHDFLSLQCIYIIFLMAAQHTIAWINYNLFSHSLTNEHFRLWWIFPNYHYYKVTFLFIHLFTLILLFSQDKFLKAELLAKKYVYLTPWYTVPHSPLEKPNYFIHPPAVPFLDFLLDLPTICTLSSHWHQFPPHGLWKDSRIVIRSKGLLPSASFFSPMTTLLKP